MWFSSIGLEPVSIGLEPVSVGLEPVSVGLELVSVGLVVLASSVWQEQEARKRNAAANIGHPNFQKETRWRRE